MTDESFSKLGNLKSRLDIDVKHNLFVPVSGRAKCAVHCWAMNRKLMIEKYIYFYNDYNINICIDYHRLLKNEQDMVAIKEELSKKFNKEENPRERKNKSMMLQSILSVTVV